MLLKKCAILNNLRSVNFIKIFDISEFSSHIGTYVISSGRKVRHKPDERCKKTPTTTQEHEISARSSSTQETLGPKEDTIQTSAIHDDR